MIDFGWKLIYYMGKGVVKMLSEERFEIILEILKKNNTVTVAELVSELNTSESTIRRDLNYLDSWWS